MNPSTERSELNLKEVFQLQMKDNFYVDQSNKESICTLLEDSTRPLSEVSLKDMITATWSILENYSNILEREIKNAKVSAYIAGEMCWLCDFFKCIVQEPRHKKRNSDWVARAFGFLAEIYAFVWIWFRDLGTRDACDALKNAIAENFKIAYDKSIKLKNHQHFTIPCAYARYLWLVEEDLDKAIRILGKVRMDIPLLDTKDFIVPDYHKPVLDEYDLLNTFTQGGAGGPIPDYEPPYFDHSL